MTRRIPSNAVTDEQRAAFKRSEANAIRPAFLGPPEDADHCPMCGQPLAHERSAEAAPLEQLLELAERYHSEHSVAGIPCTCDLCRELRVIRRYARLLDAAPSPEPEAFE